MTASMIWEVPYQSQTLTYSAQQYNMEEGVRGISGLLTTLKELMKRSKIMYSAHLHIFPYPFIYLSTQNIQLKKT
jgi:hypothetical protein